MRTNTQFTVSVQMMILYAVSDGQRLTSKGIALRTGCHPVMVRQLFGKMKRAGLLRVSAWKGITALARDPGEITLWDIYAAVEESDADSLFLFHENTSGESSEDRCFKAVLSEHLSDALQAVRESMEQVTLAQLAEEFRAKIGAGEEAEGGDPPE